MLLEELFDFDSEADIMLKVLKQRIKASLDGGTGPRVYVDVDVLVPQTLGSGEEAEDARIQFKGWIIEVGDENVDVNEISWATKSKNELFALTDFGNVAEFWITDKLYDHDLKSGDAARTFAFNNGSRFGSLRYIPRQALPHADIDIQTEHDFIKFNFHTRLERA